MKILEVIALSVLTGIVLLIVLFIIGIDSSHDSTIGIFGRVGMLLIPGFFLALTVIRLTKK